MEGRWNVLDDQKQGLADRITSTAKAMRISGTEMIKLASKRESGDKNQRDDNLQPSPKSTVLDIIMDVFSTMTSIPPGPWSSDSASPDDGGGGQAISDGFHNLELTSTETNYRLVYDGPLSCSFRGLRWQLPMLLLRLPTLVCSSTALLITCNALPLASGCLAPASGAQKSSRLSLTSPMLFQTRHWRPSKVRKGVGHETGIERT
ncbi:uncharacterized protein BT62DRAFT_219711 [Guyanagaster necrorhizus]|uniref:Uncharacterized protein n=1 Tax=Guyanagaster necrorhizus TaxID=856835 RepID=A0A9P7VQN6_9AGAR|nr:uncharacterized protein BT62DRAFT_219711 [Guyanagaster necrorhizus MCA 3950]KAG7444675.1 hypothetical protein BT62DRAFT_219711 [Guyanagaster necrorhizus MCA 3950]